MTRRWPRSLRPRSLRRSAARLLTERRGVALIEFAVIAPLMLLVYLGSFQLSDALSCHRKLTLANRLVADLVSQYAVLDAQEVDAVLRLGTQAMTPYDAERATVRVTALHTGTNGVTRVVWSKAANADPEKAGTAIDLPPAIAERGRTLIRSEVTYAMPLFAPFGLSPTVAMSDEMFVAPRLSMEVSCHDCA